MTTTNTIIWLVGIGLIVGAVLWMFRYEYVVVNQEIQYVVRVDRFNPQGICMMETDEIVSRYWHKEDERGNMILYLCK